MTGLDIYALSPEIAVVALGILVVLLDLGVRNKRALAVLAAGGLVVPALLAVPLASWPRTTLLFGTLAVDGMSVFFKFLLLIIAALVLLSSTDYLARRVRKYHGEFYALVLFSTAGMMLMASAVELISIYIALETTTLTLVGLVAFLKFNRKSNEAALKYLLLAAISSAILLYGLALLYGLSGTTSLAGIAAALGQGRLDTGVLILATALVIGGLGFKLAAVPFQMWAPDVYEGAPTPITAFLSVGSKSAGVAVVLRLFFEALRVETQVADWPLLFAILAALSMTVGNVVAIVQDNIKRMLAYSSVAHAGYVLVGVATATVQGASGVLFYLLAYSLTNLAAFIAIIAISNRVGSDQIDDYAGMGRRSPLLALALTIALLSLTGIPPMAGFVAKFYLFSTAVQAGLIVLVVIALVNSAISAYYYLRPISVMYLRPAPAEGPGPAPSGLLGTALAAAVFGVLFVGLLPAAFLAAAQAAARPFGGP